ncbi:uncharacterized protein EV422DRAFT_539411 [Fimicolochytrium jonesii]|uniref:uncharacterized protein n=1 Tax=Fimicolochytrium jonesii TaxID=1396493 RepID=UPI0022FEDDC0|nr:uncharacterized protein EV422DRAFT_539411 [Fimicolochytrium jonesii]KAI8817940.1 hypothetical protein EV422DRAFT_539411 [Fimicolochytrium jonesii]
MADRESDSEGGPGSDGGDQNGNQLGNNSSAGLQPTGQTGVAMVAPQSSNQHANNPPTARHGRRGIDYPMSTERHDDPEWDDDRVVEPYHPVVDVSMCIPGIHVPSSSESHDSPEWDDEDIPFNWDALNRFVKTAVDEEESEARRRSSVIREAITVCSTAGIGRRDAVAL